MKALYLFLCLILLPFFSHGESVEQNLARLRRCDNFYCPGRPETAMTTALRENLAMKVQGSSASIPTIRRRTKTARSKLFYDERTNSYTSRPTVNTPSTNLGGPGDALSNTGTNQASTEATAENSETPATRQGQALEGSDYSFQGSSVKAPGQSASASTQLKAGGYLYASDDDGGSADSGFGSPQVGVPQAQSEASRGNAAIAMNKQQDTGGGQDSASDGFQPASSQSISMFGRFESGGGPSGSPSGKKGLVAKAVDGLAKIADNLGEKFFGSLGGKAGRKRGQKGALKGLQAKGQKAKLKASGKMNARDLLQRELAKFNGKRNSLEFGSAGSFLFHSMCKHYGSYARSHHIPNNRGRCPTQ